MKEMFHSRSATELSALPHKSSSSHQLSRLGSTASQKLGAAPAPRAVDCVPTMPRSQSTSSLASLRRRCSTQALAEMGLSLPPDLARQAEELVVESSLAGGIFASAECHELYGNPGQAPAVSDATPESKAAAEDRMADCLSTPFTGADKNLGELVREEAQQRAQRSRLQVSQRYVQELTTPEQEAKEPDMDTDITSAAAVTEEEETRAGRRDPRTRTRRRRASREIYQFLAELGIDVEPAEPGMRPGPLPAQDAAALANMYLSYDDDRNMLSMDAPEHLAPLNLPMHSSPPDACYSPSPTEGNDHGTPSQHPISV